MAVYEVLAVQTHEWNYEVEADSLEEANAKAQQYFEEVDDGYVGICNGCTFKKNEFTIKPKSFRLSS